MIHQSSEVIDEPLQAVNERLVAIEGPLLTINQPLSTIDAPFINPKLITLNCWVTRKEPLLTTII